MAKRTNGHRSLSRVISVGAVAMTTLGAMALAEAAPAHAATKAKSKPKPVTQAQIDSYLASHPDYPKALKNGIGESASPNFGIGKPTIQVVGKPDSFPSDLAPNFGGLSISVNFPEFDATIPCTTVGSAGTAATCSPGPVPAGAAYSVTITSAVPSGFLTPAAVTGTIPDCDPAGSPTPVFCPPVTIDVQVPGTWRPIGLHVTNSITGGNLAGATYHLCAVAAPEVRRARPAGVFVPLPCQLGDEDLGSATSDSAGLLQFPGVFPSGDYEVVNTAEPDFYFRDVNFHPFTVPDVTTSTSGVVFRSNVQLQPFPPTASDDSVTTKENTKKTVHVLANDAPDGAPVHVTSLTTALHGKVKKNSNDSVTYTPKTGFVGTDHFRYTATNSLGASDSAMVTVKVTDVAPILTPIHITTHAGDPVSFDAFAGAIVPAGNTLKKTIVGDPAHGTAVDPAGTITYTPNAGFVGTDVFTYTVSDGKGGSATNTVTVTVSAALGSTLPSTGSPIDRAAAFGLGAVGVGLALFAAASLPVMRPRPKGKHRLA